MVTEVDAPNMADDPEEVESIPDDDVAYEAIQSVLEEMSSVYHEDNETLEVKLTDRASAALDQETVMVQSTLPDEMDPPVTGANILRLLDDLLAHEVAHVNWSDLDSKQEFADCYPGWGKVPGFVANVLEDEYVDAKRKRKWFGMREKLAYYVWLHMNTEDRAPPVDVVEEDEGRTSALMTGLFQLALAGYVKGLDDASDDIAQFCNDVEPLVERVRTEDDPATRFKLYHAVMQVLIRYAPDPDDVDEDAMDDRMRESHGGTGGHGGHDTPDSPDADEPEVDMPEPLKQALEELLEELMENGEFPEPPEADEPEVEGAEPGGESEEAEPEESGEESEMDESGDSAENAPDDPSETGESEKPATDADADTSGDSRDVDSILGKYDPRNLKVVN